MEVQLNITREEVQEFFGSERFSCECVAWNRRGPKRSQPSHIEIACECKFPSKSSFQQKRFLSFLLLSPT